MKAKSGIRYALRIQRPGQKSPVLTNSRSTRTEAYNTLSEMAPQAGESKKGLVTRDSRLRIMRARGWSVVRARLVEI